MDPSQLAKLVRVAVVEDDVQLRDDLVTFLLHRGFETIGFPNAELFQRIHAVRPFSLVLLDINLPGISGVELTTQLRAPPGDHIAVIMLTAIGEDIDKVLGLAAGADAYLVKNVSLEVIEATCVSVLRRVAGAASTPATAMPAAPAPAPAPEWQLKSGGDTPIIRTPNGVDVPLTYIEFILLRQTLTHVDQPCSRAKLLAAMNKAETPSAVRNIDNQVNRLRRKVVALSGLHLPLRTCYGSAYIFCADNSSDFSPMDGIQ